MKNTNPHSSSVITIAAYLIIIAIAMSASDIISPILFALFISVILTQPIKWLQKHKVPAALSVFLVLTGAFLLFFGVAEVIGNSIAQLLSSAPKYEARLTQLTASIFSALQGLGFDVSLSNLESAISAEKIVSYSGSFLESITSLMGNMFLILFILIFVLLELSSFSVKINAVYGPTKGSKTYFSVIRHHIRRYLGLMTGISALTGFVVWIALIIIGVDYAILWAFIAFALNFIPNIGSIVAAMPAVLFAGLQLGFGGAAYTFFSFGLINMVIGNIVQPQIMGKGLGLSTLVVFISLIFWGYIFGTVGMFLSTPLTMIVKNILQHNPNTKWIAILLGTQAEAQAVIDSNKQND